MTRPVAFACCLLLSIASASVHAKENPSSAAYIGFWYMSSDEDNGPLGEIVEFRSDDSYIAYDKNCKPFAPLPTHNHNGDIYVTAIIEGKGPVAIIYHSTVDGTLSYTSPRTHNSAFYTRVQASKCRPRP